MKRHVSNFVVGVVASGLLVADLWASSAEAAAPRPPHGIPAVRPAPVSPTPTTRVCKAMTWGVRGQKGLTTWVGAIDGSTNAYDGDTPCSESRPMLCFQPGTRPRPAAFSFPALVSAIGWTGGAIALLPEVIGLEVRSREVADRMCATRFGEGWRMAEFHDGGAWGFGAEGELPRDSRFWVAINDQPSNMWNR